MIKNRETLSSFFGLCFFIIFWIVAPISIFILTIVYIKSFWLFILVIAVVWPILRFIRFIVGGILITIIEYLESRLKKNIYYEAWALLWESYSLLWDAYEFDVHRKSPPKICELLSSVHQMCKDRKISFNSNKAQLIWDTYQALNHANIIYDENVKDAPGYLQDIDLDMSEYAEKELPSEAGERMLPYLDEAEKHLNNLDNLLNLSRNDLPSFWK